MLMRSAWLTLLLCAAILAACADDPAPWQPDVQPFPRATWTTESPAPAGEFVLVPAGEFWMGSNSWLNSAGEVTTEFVRSWRHRVTISRPMWVGVVEVTRAEWFAVFPDDPRAEQPATTSAPQRSRTLFTAWTTGPSTTSRNHAAAPVR